MGPHLKRLPGWEGRLAATIEAARLKPYVIGEHDCFRLACAVVEALTGADLWSQWAGRYRTRRQALRRIHEYAGGGFTEAACKLFGGAAVPVGLAARGDVLEYMDAVGEQHLGICIGSDVAVLGPGGLKYVRRSACRHVWRIG